MKRTKVYAAYLPQYHEIEENNEFWGEGYTDWNGVKKASPQFEGHYQPRVPLNDNYYDLSKIEAIRWQVELANQYGIDGFNIYHYWFKNGHMVLQKPAELILKNKDIHIGYFFSWDNTSWIRSWSNIKGNTWSLTNEKQREKKENESPYLLELDYGGKKEWKEHFDYLLPFFKDSRYLRIDDKPVFAFMSSADASILRKMGAYWSTLAKENGLKGVHLLTGVKVFLNRKVLDGQFVFQPRISAWGKKEAIEIRLKKYLHLGFKKDGAVKYMYDYDQVWKRIIRIAQKNRNNDLIFEALVAFDDTPRRGTNAKIVLGDSPEKFKKYFSKLYRICCESNKEFVLVNAWNEWGEGAYLEPDTKYGYAYLEALYSGVNELNG